MQSEAGPPLRLQMRLGISDSCGFHNAVRVRMVNKERVVLVLNKIPAAWLS